MPFAGHVHMSGAFRYDDPQFECSGSGAWVGSASGVIAALYGRLDEQSALRHATGAGFEAVSAELICAAYRTWGADEFASHLYGDFAIILWDDFNRRLILSRSPSGLYPIFYMPSEARFRFADSQQTLCANTPNTTVPDEQALAQWLILRPCLSNRTIFTDILRVAPGTSVIVQDGRMRITVCWHPDELSSLHLPTHSDYADALRETLQKAVDDRLHAAEGNVAAQLSGGLDSSSVAVLAAEQLAKSGKSLYAFTAVPHAVAENPVAGRFFDEGDHAAAVAAKYGNIVHTRVPSAPVPLFQTLDLYADVEGNAPFNPHHLQWIDSTYAAATSADARTLFTGNMGNFTISGSGDVAVAQAMRDRNFAQAARLFAEARGAGTRSCRHLPGAMLSAFAPRVLDAADRLRGARNGLEEFSGLNPKFAREHGIDFERWNRRQPFPSARAFWLSMLNRFDFGMFFEAPRRLYGLNPVDPTFDRRVVELTLRIPFAQYFAGGIPRALIRTAMKDRLPDVVRLERRRGLQSADFLGTLHRERENIAKEFNRMQEIDLLRRALDLPRSQEFLYWTKEQAIAYGWHQYSNRLMRTVSIGRFIRRMVDGTLFSTLAPAQQEKTGFSIRSTDR